MRFRTDWKFVATLLVTIAGVVVPVWLWQADLSSKSLAITLATREPLQPKEREGLAGLEISVDGARIENPYLVVFEIRNDGSKPIVSNDFESSIDIRLDSETSFVRSRITEKIPKDIDTDITFEKKRISLKPTLLNPTDTIKVTAITSGVTPIFNTKARVAGIHSVSIEDGTTTKPNKAKLTLLLVGAVCLFVASMTVFRGATDAKGVFLRQRAAAYIGLVTSFPGVGAFMIFLEAIGIQGFWYFMLCVLIMIIPISFLSSALNLKPAEPQGVSIDNKPA